MASYKMEIKDGIISKTLTFMSHELTEVWEEENTICRNTIEKQSAQVFPELIGKIEMGIIEDVGGVFADACDIFDAVNHLTVYEESQLN